MKAGFTIFYKEQSMDSKKIGATIAMLRTSKNMTQADLGDRIGVTFQAVSKWERGVSLK